MERKYEVVINYIEHLVHKGSLKQGERLPSIRALTEEFQCNKSTVIRAYEKLESEHKIYSIPKSGYYLVERSKASDEEGIEIDFSEVLPDPKLLPYREFNHCINKAVEQYKDKLFSYGETQGLESLRKVLALHFSEYQVFTTSDNIFITSGAQQALSILCRMAFPNGNKNILVEQPTYSLMHRLSEINGDELLGIKRNYNGINLEELEKIFKHEKVKFFYTMPRFQNPLGTSYTEREKKRIVELAEKYDVYIIEDDYLTDIETNKKILPLHYYDKYGRVVYVKSFSKTFMPGIRIGAVTVSDVLKSEFLKHKRCYDLNTSVLSQGALEIFINSGMYKNHIRKTQIEYKKKMDALRDCLKKVNNENIEFFIPQTGFFVWIKLSRTINLDFLMRRLGQQNIRITHGKEFFIEGKSCDNGFRICISRMPTEKMRRGIRILLEEIERINGI